MGCLNVNTPHLSVDPSTGFAQETDMAALAAAMSDASRMKILCALMDGRAWTATELSAVAEIAPSTTSAHLAKLLKASLITGLSQGRHRYFRLYSAHIATLLETMMNVTFRAANPSRAKVPTALLTARTCYDHLAGEIAVRVYQALLENQWINTDGNSLTPQGRALFLQLGIPLDDKSKRKACCPCLDWSERRFHLGGQAGAALLTFLDHKGWIKRIAGYREVTITDKGYKGFSKYFGIDKIEQPNR